MSNKKTYQLALGGICLALTVIFMFGASIVPGVELTIYALSSLFIAVVILESGVKSGIALYIAAILLGFLIVPDKVSILPYACVFGLYGIVKYYIEKIRKPAAQVILKTLFFAAAMTAALVVFKGLLFGSGDLPNLPTWLLIIGGVLVLLFYDFIYTLLIQIYAKRFRKADRPHFNLSKKDVNDR